MLSSRWHWEHLDNIVFTVRELFNNCVGFGRLVNFLWHFWNDAVTVLCLEFSDGVMTEAWASVASVAMVRLIGASARARDIWRGKCSILHLDWRVSIVTRGFVVVAVS